MSKKLSQSMKDNIKEELNILFIEYMLIIIIAKFLKYDEIAEALDTNGCNLALIQKIMRS